MDISHIFFTVFNVFFSKIFETSNIYIYSYLELFFHLYFLQAQERLTEVEALQEIKTEDLEVLEAELSFPLVPKVEE